MSIRAQIFHFLRMISFQAKESAMIQFVEILLKCLFNIHISNIRRCTLLTILLFLYTCLWILIILCHLAIDQQMVYMGGKQSSFAVW